MALVIAGLMFSAAVAAVVARPVPRVAGSMPALYLSSMVPSGFGDWREERQPVIEVVNPQRQAAIDATYDQTLERIFVNPDGYRIMLSVAYGSDHRGALRTHEPEACYIGAGFLVHSREVLRLETQFGSIPVRRLLTSKGRRMEPVTYWIKVGDRAVMPSQAKLVELSYVLTGRIPDGLLFRVSSIDPDRVRANRMHDHFIHQLLQAVPAEDRRRLSGLGASPALESADRNGRV
jgi:EpsI family protein